MTRSLVRWTPRGNAFRTQMGRLIDDAFNDFLAPVATTGEAVDSDWVPPVDVSEDDDRLIFTAELPGMTAEQVEITLENQILTLSGERKFAGEEHRDNFHRIERAYGTFSRAFRLPLHADTGAAKATFVDGVLTVELPKSEAAKPKKLEIS